MFPSCCVSYFLGSLEVEEKLLEIRSMIKARPAEKKVGLEAFQGTSQMENRDRKLCCEITQAQHSTAMLLRKKKSTKNKEV